MPSLRVFLGLAAFFAVLTLLFTYPIWLDLDGLLSDLADAGLTTWIMAWDAHALLSDPLNLFNANIFYPHVRTLAFSENLLGSAIFVAPINWMGQPVLAHNVVFLATFLLSGIGTALWIRYLTGSTAAGLLSGVIWTFAPAKFQHVPHIHLLAGQWIPFAFLSMSIYARTGSSRYALLCAFLVGLQYLTSINYGLFLLPCLFAYGFLLFAHAPRATVTGDPAPDSPGPTAGVWPNGSGPRRLLRDLVAMSVIIGLLTIPVSLPYLQVSSGEGFYRVMRDQLHYSAGPGTFLSASSLNKASHMQALHGRFFRTESYFVGVPAAALLLVALFWLLPVAWRGNATPASGPPPLRRRLYGFSGAATILFGALHFGGAIGAELRGPPTGMGWLLTLNQLIHPAVWLAVFATATVLLWPSRTRYGSDHDRSRSAVYVVVLSYLLLLTYLLSLGPIVHGRHASIGYGPYWFFYEWLLPYRGLRTPGRIGFLWLLFAAALVGFALAAILRKNGRPMGQSDLGLGRSKSGGPDAAVLAKPARIAITAALIVLVVLEYRVWPLPASRADPGGDLVNEWLARQPGDGAVLHLPIRYMGRFWSETRYMLGSMLHWRPLINGFSGFVPEDAKRLGRIEPFSPPFYSRLRELPAEYLVVHERALPRGRAQRRTLTRQLMEDTDNLEFAARVPGALVFRPRRDWDFGQVVRREFSEAALRRAQRVVFEARLAVDLQEANTPDLGPAAGEEKPRGFYLGVTWADENLGRWPLTSEWQTFEIEAPADFASPPTGVAKVRIAPHYPHEFATGTVWLGAHIMLDIQNPGVSVILNYESLGRRPDYGYQAILLDAEGDAIERWETFEPTRRGVRRLREFIDRVPAGGIIACALNFEEVTALPTEAIEALRAIGSPAGGDTYIKLAVLGVKGGGAGSAIEHKDHQRAFVVIGDGEQPFIQLRDIRFE